MGIRVLQGREFTADDDAQAPRVVLISDVAADRFWPGEDAVGKRIRFGDEEWTTIVGITAGTRAIGLSQAPRPELYFPYAQRPGRAMALVVKSDAAEGTVANLLRADLREIAPTLPLSGITTMSDRVLASSAQARFVMQLTAIFGGLALALAAVGIYGVMSYNVNRRTAEMGVRMALGAGRGRVLSMVLSEGLGLTAAGVAVGLLAAFWATSWLGSMLFDVSPRDIATFTGAPLVLAGVAVLACLVPALRATRVDPIRALRVD
jgi:putative ABC transport system permease protein